MPGANCSIFGCSVSRNKVGIAIFGCNVSGNKVGIAIFGCNVSGNKVGIAIFGCNVSGNKVGIAISKVAAGKDDSSANWRSKLVDIIRKHRVIDLQLRKQIGNRRLHTCERYFTEDCLNHHTSKITLLAGTIPTLYLPRKSFPSSSTTTKPRVSAETIAQERSVLLNIAAHTYPFIL